MKTLRTSLRLNESTGKRLRIIAIERGTSVQALLEAAAERIVAQAEKAGPAK